jgi:hypothetical protein
LKGDGEKVAGLDFGLVKLAPGQRDDEGLDFGMQAKRR